MPLFLRKHFRLYLFSFDIPFEIALLRTVHCFELYFVRLHRRPKAPYANLVYIYIYTYLSIKVAWGLGLWGPGFSEKMHKKGTRFINKWWLFDVFAISQIFGGVISGNINPPGWLPGTNPGFLETQISANSRVWKRFGWFLLMIFWNLVRTFVSGTNFSRRILWVW